MCINALKAINPVKGRPWNGQLLSASDNTLSPSVDSEFSFDERMAYIRKYGSHCMSFSILQPEMEYFDMPGIGFIGYRSLWGAKIVLSDPVCDKKDREHIIVEFIRKYPDQWFWIHNRWKSQPDKS